MPRTTVTTLRGAGVEVDVGRAGLVAIGVCLLALAATVTVLLAAGIEKNAQITRLRHDGVPVEVTVTGCFGLMGGSGSNLAGYDCKGTFTLGGRRYSDAIPGNALFSSGTRLRGIAVPEDPGLFSTPRVLATERPSSRVFLLPGLLLAALVLGTAGLIMKRRGLRAASRRSDG